MGQYTPKDPQLNTASGFKVGQDATEQPDLYIKDGVEHSRKTGKPTTPSENYRKSIFDAAVGFKNMLKGK